MKPAFGPTRRLVSSGFIWFHLVSFGLDFPRPLDENLKGLKIFQRSPADHDETLTRRWMVVKGEIRAAMGWVREEGLARGGTAAASGHRTTQPKTCGTPGG